MQNEEGRARRHRQKGGWGLGFDRVCIKEAMSRWKITRGIMGFFKKISPVRDQVMGYRREA
jgi:hypothetical protein